jgi:hypothetical protein
VVAAEAPPAAANETPAIPKTGTALLRRFRLEACFAFDILLVSHTFKPGFHEWHGKRTIIRIGLHSQYAKPITLKVGRNCLVP